MRRFAAPLLLLLVALAPVAPLLVRGEVPLFRDHAGYFIPLRAHTAAVLRGGELPLWNPWNGSGEAWLANPQTNVFYPPAWIFLVLPFETAYVLFLVLHFWIAGWSAARLYARWAGPAAAFIAGAALMLSGPLVSLADVGNNLATLAWVPLAIRLALESREGKPRGARLALVLALAFLAGEPLYAAVAALLVALALASGRRWSELAVAALGSAGLSAVQLLPFLYWVRGSDRAAGLRPGEAFQHSLALSDWLALVMPFATPNGRFLSLRLSQQFIPSLYVTLPLVMLALAAGVGAMTDERAGRKRVVAALLVTMGTLMVLSAGGRLPLVEELLVAANANAIRYPARLVPIAALAILGLAAIGLERIRSTPLATRLAITTALAALGTIRFLALEPMGRPAMVLRFTIFLAWLVLFGALWVVVPKFLASRGGSIALCLFLLADLAWSAVPMLQGGAMPAPWPWAVAREGAWKSVRVEGEAEARPEGYRNLLDRRFDFSTAAPVIPRHWGRFHAEAISGRRDDLVDAASVRWIASPREVLPPGFVKRGEEGAVRLFENEGARPMAQVWSGGVAAGEREALEAMLAGGFDPRTTLLISGAPDVRPGGMEWGGSVEAGVRSVAAEVASRGGGFLVVTLNAARGWSVKVDGRDGPLLTADGLFLATEIPPGTHRVEFTYRAPGLVEGGAITLLSVMLLTALTWWRRRGRTTQPH